MRFVPIGQKEEKPSQPTFVPLQAQTEEVPLVSPEEMLTPPSETPRVGPVVKPGGFQPELLSEQFKSGVSGLQESYYANTAKNNAQLLNIMDRIDRGEQIRPIDDVLGYADMDAETRKQTRDAIQSAMTTGVAKTIAYGAERQGFKRNENADLLVNLADKGEIRQAYEVFKQDPLGIIQQLSVESAPNALPSLVAGGAGLLLRGGVAGLMTGLATGSFPIEYMASITDSLRESGVDLKDAAAVEAKLRDPKFLEEAGKRAVTRGAVIATADAASGKLLMPFKAGQLGKNAARGVANIGTETGLEMAGEAAAQAATDEEIKLGQVIAEGFGAGPQAAIGTVLRTVSEGAKPPEAPRPAERKEPEFVPLEAEAVTPVTPAAPPVAPPTTPPEAAPPAAPTPAPAAPPTAPEMTSEEITGLTAADFEELPEEPAAPVTPKAIPVTENIDLSPIKNATDRKSYEAGVLNVAQQLPSGSIVTDSETNISWTVNKWTTKSGTEIIEFDGGKGNVFQFEKKPGNEWKSVGDVFFPQLPVIDIAQVNKSVTPVTQETATSAPAPVEPPPVQNKTGGLPIQEIPLKDLKVSDEVPQFKIGATKEGVVEPLGGKFERTGVAPIQVWRRTDGSLEVISGRHRLDLAKRSKEKTIPAQIHDEAQGFTRDKAAILDAELNIRDGQGKVKDYVGYFKGSGISPEEANARGLLARAIGKRSYAIAADGSEELITAHRADAVGDEAAYLIALNAPQDPSLQAVGIKAVQDGKSAASAVNLMQAVKTLAGERETTTDMFGFDESAMKEAEEMAKIAARKQREIQQRLSVMTGASKNPELARKEGIDVKDPQAVRQRVDELRQAKATWDNWSSSSDLIGQIRAEMGPSEFALRAPTAEELRAQEAAAAEREAAELKAIADREVGLFGLQPQVQEREAPPSGDLFGARGLAEQPPKAAPAAPPIETGLFAAPKGGLLTDAEFDALLAKPYQERTQEEKRRMLEYDEVVMSEEGAETIRQPEDGNEIRLKKYKDGYVAAISYLGKKEGQSGPLSAFISASNPIYPDRKSAIKAKAEQIRDMAVKSKDRKALLWLGDVIRKEGITLDKPITAKPSKEKQAEINRERQAAKKEKAEKILSSVELPDNMAANVFKTSDGYGAGLYDTDSEQYVNGSIRRFKGDDAQKKAEAYAKQFEEKPAEPDIGLENIDLANIDQTLPGAKKKLPPGRSPELAAAAQQLQRGEITKKEFDELVNRYKPIPVYTEPLKPATPEQMFDALDTAKREKINPDIKAGTSIGLRLDIPAFNRKGVFVVSIHEKRTPSAAGKTIGYGSVAKIKDVTFGLGKETEALKIAAGASKDVLQTMEGKWVPTNPEEAYREAQAAIKNPEWIQIGIDPTRHSYFYDRRTTQPVIKADEIIQIGNMILGKGVEFGKKEDFLFNIASDPVTTVTQVRDGIENARKQQLETLARLARKKSELIKKVRNYGSDIETQRLLNELEDEIKMFRLGSAIREPSTSAEAFLKHARDAMDGTGPFRERVLSPDVFATIQAAYIKTPWILEGLKLSIKTPKQGDRASGIFLPYERVVRLYSGTTGVEDPVTPRHELMHSLEQMMTKGAKDAVIKAWANSLEKAIKKYTDKRSQEYFNKIMEFLENPSETTRQEALAVLPSYDLYQYINPSEYWAVNAEKLFSSKLGTAWDRFKKAIRKLFEGLKSVFGFNNTYAVHKIFDDLMKTQPPRMGRESLVNYLLSGKADIKFLMNVKDDQDLIDKYNRPITPMIDTTPVKTFVINQAQFAKQFFKDAIKDPRDAIGTLFTDIGRGIIWLRNKNIFMGAGLESADMSKYGGQLRNTQGQAVASVALDNALHGPNIAVQVLYRGDIKFRPSAGIFTAAKSAKSMLDVYRAEASLKLKLGAQLATDIIQGYLEAKRSRSILNELDKRNKEVEVLRNELATLSPSDPDYDRVRNELAEAADDLVRIDEIARNKINMTEQEIDDFIAREKVHPELREIMDAWTQTNQNLLKFWKKVGLLTEGRYKTLSSIEDYVPWYRIMNDEEDVHSPVQATTRAMTNIGKEKLFKKGKPTTVVDFEAEDGQTEFKIQPSSVINITVNNKKLTKSEYTSSPKGEITFKNPLSEGDVVVIEGAREIENIIDNMTRNVMRMTMNGLRQYAASRIVQEYATRNEKGKIRVFPKTDREKGRFDYIANGIRVVVEIKDPLQAEAVLGMEKIGMESIKAFAAVANMTRRLITINPIFQVKQVFKDGPSAAYITGVKNPTALTLGVYKGLIDAMRDNDPAIDYLRAAGIGGFQSPTRTPEAEIKRKIGIINQSNYNMIIAALDQFGDSADIAQRVAVYKRVMKETGDEMQATYQASTVMPFHRHGSGAIAQFFIKTVPFMNAYANSIDVLASASIGGNLKGKSRLAALTWLGAAGITLSFYSLMYAIVAGMDDDYWELDDQTRARNIILPFSKKITGEMIMMPMNTGAAWFFKVLPELIYNRVSTQGTKNKMDAQRFWKAMGESALDSLLGPEPIPSVIRPAIEVALDYSFFTERKLTPKGLEDLEPARQFTSSTSEIGKIFGSVTDKLNPIQADHLMRSIFGTVGAFTQWSSNLIANASRPEMTTKEIPVVGAFVAPKYPRGKEDLFYDLFERTRRAYKSFDDMIETMDVDEAVKYIEKNVGLIALHDYTSRTEAELKQINRDISTYGRASEKMGLTPKERREIIDNLQLIKRGLLEGIEEYRVLAEEIKLAE
jgi:hypothetical protein